MGAEEAAAGDELGMPLSTRPGSATIALVAAAFIAATPSGARSDPDRSDRRPHVLFVFDRPRLSLDAARRGIEWVGRFLERQAQESDRITLATTDSDVGWTGRLADLKDLSARTRVPSQQASGNAPAERTVEVDLANLVTLRPEFLAVRVDADQRKPPIAMLWSGLSRIVEPMDGDAERAILLLVSSGRIACGAELRRAPEMVALLDAAVRHRVAIVPLTVGDAGSVGSSALAGPAGGVDDCWQVIASATGGTQLFEPDDPAVALARIVGTAPTAAGRLDSPPSLPLRLAVLVGAPAASGKTAVRFLAEIDPAALAFREKNGRSVATVESKLSVVAKDAGPVEKSSHRLEAALTPEQRERLSEVWIRSTRDLELEPGSYEASYLVRDIIGGGEASAVVPIEVKPTSAFRISTPVLSDLILADGSVAETARRRFQAGARLVCQYEVLGAFRDTGSSHVVASFVLAHADGAVLVKGGPEAATPGEGGRLRVRLGIRLGDLSEGHYVLRLSVRDDGSGRLIEVDESLEVFPPSGLSIEAALQSLRSVSESPIAPRPPVASTGVDDIGRYLDLVGRFRRGRLAVSGRTPEDAGLPSTETVVDRLLQSADRRCDAVCRQAAALFETEVGVALLRATHSGEAKPHLSAAWKLMLSGDPAPGRLRDWLLAVGHAHRSVGALQPALDLTSECVARFPEEAACELARAMVYEDIAYRAVPRASYPIPPARRTLMREKALLRRSGLAGDSSLWMKKTRPGRYEQGMDPVAATLAHECHERVSRLAPNWDEARLCLARYHLRRGQLDDARRQASWVLEHSEDEGLQARAHLLLGLDSVEAKRLDAAIVHYRRALVGNPASHAARLALSQALLRAGRASEAAKEARATLEAAEDSASADGWLSVRVGAGIEHQRLMRKLRAEVCGTDY